MANREYELISSFLGFMLPGTRGDRGGRAKYRFCYGIPPQASEKNRPRYFLLRSPYGFQNWTQVRTNVDLLKHMGEFMGHTPIEKRKEE